MTDDNWDDSTFQKEDRGVHNIRGGSTYNKNHDVDHNGGSYGHNSGSYGHNNGDQDRSSRSRGGRGGGGRGGGRFNGRDGGNDHSNDLHDQQPPVSDKPRPTYIPPETTEEDCYSVQAGINFNQYEKIEVKVSGDNVPTHIESFKNSGLREVLLDKLSKCQYTIPTPIQKYSIPIIIKGRDIIASAQTGSGKTVSSVNFMSYKQCIFIFLTFNI